MEFKMEEPKLKRFVWRDEDTWKLIQVWRRNILNLRRTKRNKYVYDNMSRELQSMGLIIGIEEIRNKIKNLTKKYREEISLEDTSNTSEWKFYHPIKRILGQARLNSLSHIYRSIPNYDSLTIQPPTSYLSIVSEPDITISEIVKNEPNTGSDDDDNVKTESTMDDSVHDNDDPELNTSVVQNNDRKIQPNNNPFKPLLKIRSDIIDSSSSILDTLDAPYESESDNHSSISTHAKNKLEKKRLKKRKYEIEEELLQEIKRSNHIAEKNEQTALILAAEANKLLERSNHIQERLFDLLSSRL